MWTDLCYNLILLSFAASDATAYYFILAVSNCGYIIFNFLNLNAGWIHRVDAGHVKRPYKAPTIILAAGTALSFVNAIFMGAGAKTWHLVDNPSWYDNPLWIGLLFAACIFPVFWFRHYIQDGGKFPARMLEDLGVKEEGGLGERKAGMLPYVVLAAGLIVVIACNFIFTV
jgi:amino acid transporter